MIETKIGTNSLHFKWEYEVPCLKGNQLIIQYDEDISKTPKHLANFMFSLILLDSFIWQKHPIIFEELTITEITTLKDLLKLSTKSRGCCGDIQDVKSPHIQITPPEISAKNILDDEEAERGGPVFVSNGFGKDALNSLCISKELGYETRGFTVGQHTNDEAWKDRLNVINKLREITGINTTLIMTNFFQLRPYEYKETRMVNFGFYPYYFALPLAYVNNAEAVLSGVEIHNSKVHNKTYVSPCVLESIFGADYVSKATGIKHSSPTRAVTEHGSQKVFTERYAELKHIQRSCDKGTPYCNKCSKCARTSLNLEILDRDPAEVGLIPYTENRLDFSTYHRHKNSDKNVENKYYGLPYESWVEGANEDVFKYMWNGKEIKDIMSEHVPIYDYDPPGLDKRGYILAPSKWGPWIENGLVKYLK